MRGTAHRSENGPISPAKPLIVYPGFGLQRVRYTGLTTVACIPAFNEERTIGKVIVRALPYVDQVLVCDDASSTEGNGIDYC